MKKVSCLQFITAGSYVDVSSTDVNWFLTVFRAGGVFQGSDEEGPGHGLCCGRYPHSARIPQERQRCVGLLCWLWTKLPCFRWTLTLFWQAVPPTPLRRDHPGPEGEPEMGHRLPDRRGLLCGRVLGRRALPALHQPHIAGAPGERQQLHPDQLITHITSKQHFIFNTETQDQFQVLFFRVSSRTQTRF